VTYEFEMEAEPAEVAFSVRDVSDCSYYDNGFGDSGRDTYPVRLDNGTLFGGQDFENARRAEEREEDSEELRLSATKRRLLREQSPRRLAEIRGWLESEARATGCGLDELLATVTRGPVAAHERDRYDLLAMRVVRLRDAGFTLEVVGLVLGKGRPTALRLEMRGRAILEDRFCKRHSAHKVDCPACARLVP
jgi:hypothetical protein